MLLLETPAIAAVVYGLLYSLSCLDLDALLESPVLAVAAVPDKIRSGAKPFPLLPAQATWQRNAALHAMRLSNVNQNESTDVRYYGGSFFYRNRFVLDGSQLYGKFGWKANNFGEIGRTRIDLDFGGWLPSPRSEASPPLPGKPSYTISETIHRTSQDVLAYIRDPNNNLKTHPLLRGCLVLDSSTNEDGVLTKLVEFDEEFNLCGFIRIPNKYLGRVHPDSEQVPGKGA
eukprot:gene6289-2921_t